MLDLWISDDEDQVDYGPVEEEPSQVTAPEHAVDDAAPHASEDEDEDDYEDVDDFIRESLGEEEGR